MKRIRIEYPEERINKRFVVYQMYCRKSGKSYIGITADFDSRLATHWHYARNGRNTVLGKAIRKYGKKSFIVFKIDSADTWKEACEKEKQYIISVGTRTINGYNMTDGGDGVPGIEMTAETREKMRQSHLGKNTGSDNPMHGKPGSMLGRKWTEEQRKSHSERCKGRTPWNKGLKGKQVAWNKGKTGIFSEEALQKIRNKTWKWSDELREKMKIVRAGCQVGTKHSQCKLTEEDVLEIRRLYNNKKFNQKQLAERFNMTQPNIHCIINRKSWVHI